MKRHDTGANTHAGVSPATGGGSTSAEAGTTPAAPAPHPATGGRDVVEGLWEELSQIARVDSETQAIDRIQALTRIINTSGALLAEATDDFRQLRQERETAQGVPSRDQARGVKEEIALARGESPYLAAKHAGLAYNLTHELPHTMELLRQGRISEYKASIIEAETHDLTTWEKADIDTAIAKEAETLGVRTLMVRVRHMSETTNPQAAVTKHERCVTERRVTLRPAAGGMSYLTALLPQKQAGAVYTNLHQAATTHTTTGNTGKSTTSTTSSDTTDGESTSTTSSTTGGESTTGTPAGAGDATAGVRATACGEGVRPR